MMKFKSFWLSASALSLCMAMAAGVAAQDIRGGVMNGKAISLPNPVYSDEARRLNLGGTVIVDVTVDETGNVIAARAVDEPRRSGDSQVMPAHPVLRQLAEDAARQARFTPTKISGKPVKVTGTIVYNIGSGERQPPSYRDAATARVVTGAEPPAANAASGRLITADTTSKPRQISGGVLNGKAQNLVKPVYPPGARAVNAEGAVTVQVVIDEDGRVESAHAVAGHPLLRAAATEAARGSTFAPTMLAGQKVRVSGVITYNFVGSMTPGILGFELGFAERGGRFGMDPRSLASRLPADWHQERSMLESLALVETKGDPPPVRKADSLNGSQSGGISAAQDSGLSREGMSSIRNLKGIVEGRLGADPIQYWHFQLGHALGRMSAELNDPGQTAANLAELEQLETSAPAGVAESWLSQLRAINETGRGDLSSVAVRDKLYESAKALRNARISMSW